MPPLPVGTLLSPTSFPARLPPTRRRNRLQLDELRRVTRYPTPRDRLSPAPSGCPINDPRSPAVLVKRVLAMDACAEPADTYLLALAMAGAAGVLLTGGGRHLLALERHWRTRILTARAFLAKTDGPGSG